jgi:elongation factor 4
MHRCRRLIFDSHYDPFRGTMVHFRISNREPSAGDRISFMSNNATYKVEEVGVFQIVRVPKKKLCAGEVGYMIAGIKTVSDTRCGDTVTQTATPAKAPMPGFKEAKPVVFSSIYPVASDGYEDLIVAMEKLKLNDASLIYEKDSSAALGFGFRCGFLGLLHLEVVQERLEREYDLSLILTAPSVRYRLMMNDGEELIIDNPGPLSRPDQHRICHGALISGGHHHPGPLHGRGDEAVPGAPGHQQELPVPDQQTPGNDFRTAPGGGDLRFLRQAQIGHPGLRLLRLRH